MAHTGTMNRATEEGQSPSPPATPAPGRSVAFTLFLTLGFLVLGLLIANSFLSKRTSRTPGPAGPTVDQSSTSAATADAAIPTTQGPAERAAPHPEADVAGTPVVSVPLDSSVARALIASLSQMQMADGKVTPGQAEQVKRSLQQLVAQGPAALPAIRQFLEQNQDLAFGDEGAKLAGVPSLRAGLLDALGQIGGPDSLALSRQVLQGAMNPFEIALATRNLEAGAPGQYTQESLDAARQVLDQIAAGKLQVADPAPLFQVLESYGDAKVAGDLEKLAATWKYYGTMALAGLPNGQGIQALVNLAEQPASDPAQYNKLPVQMLAQLSAQYPDASSALLEMARQNRIPDNAWRAIAAGLGGNQYQFARQYPQNSFPEGSGVESGSSAIGGPSETFYSVPLSNSGSDITQRLALIDQLLAANANNPIAIQTLTQVRARLAR